MKEARRAANLAVAISVQKIQCEGCKVYVAKQQGRMDYFKAACTPQLCKLRALQVLHFRNLWLLFDRIISWQRSELHGRVDAAFKGKPEEILNAFCEYRAALELAWERVRKRTGGHG